MDVEDKTRFVFPVCDGDAKNASSPLTQKVGEDHTVFVNLRKTPDSKLPASEKNSHFGISSSADASLDATVLVRSIHPASVPIENAERSFVSPSSRADAVVIKNRFELIDLLGVGGMGAVYKAADRRKIEAGDRDPYVAIKVLNDDFRNHPDAFVSLQREAHKSQTLAHPNIVNVYDFDRDGDMVFMTMEFLKGLPLDALLREKAGVGLPFDQALSVLLDIANALIYAHTHHIVHSDFKPGNIFVTESQKAKVFDFGISRAVNPSGMFNTGAYSHTVFDAGSLGALTPAYASLEMLQGQHPLPSDDVYALACVAYEIFCGRHPFDKTPADQAKQKRMTPKRIKSLSRRQWRALEQALAFTRNKRTATVGEFVQQFYGKTRLPLWGGLASVVSLAVAAGFYGTQYSEKVIDESVIKEELQVELQQSLTKTRAADKMAALERMLQTEEISERWEADLRVELADYQQLVPDDAATPLTVQHKVAEKLLAAASNLLKRDDLHGVQPLLNRAAAWGAADSDAAEISHRLEQKYDEERLRVAQAQEAEQLRMNAAAASKRQERERQQTENRNKMIAAAIARIENALHCSPSMDISGALTRHLAALNQLDRSLAQRLVADIVSDLGVCLQKLQHTQPQKAESLLAEAKVLFPRADVFESLRIDHCIHLAAGSGRRGARFTCQDKLASGGEGPVLVVVESPAQEKLAIGKYEVSAADMKAFCVSSGECGNLGRLAQSIPVSNVSVGLSQQYLKWLSNETGYHYRLPTDQEWLAAAAAGNSSQADPDRNCHLRFGAIQKGAELVSVNAGKANANGLMNQVGNVQEWALSSDGSLLALGGSREDPMSRCLVTTRKNHDGAADPITGFRVAREF